MNEPCPNSLSPSLYALKRRFAVWLLGKVERAPLTTGRICTSGAVAFLLFFFVRCRVGRLRVHRWTSAGLLRLLHVVAGFVSLPLARSFSLLSLPLFFQPFLLFISLKSKQNVCYANYGGWWSRCGSGSGFTKGGPTLHSMAGGWGQPRQVWSVLALFVPTGSRSDFMSQLWSV